MDGPEVRSLPVLRNGGRATNLEKDGAAADPGRVTRYPVAAVSTAQAT